MLPSFHYQHHQPYPIQQYQKHNNDKNNNTKKKATRASRRQHLNDLKTEMVANVGGPHTIKKRRKLRYDDEEGSSASSQFESR